MESDGETMLLVLYLREEFEHETLYRHADRFGREAEQEFRSPVFPVFCQPGYRNVQVQIVLDHFAYDFHLPLSTVGDDQVGQGSLFDDGTLVAATYDLFHGGIVVRADNRFDVVFPVIFFRWFRHFEDDTRSYRVASLYIGFVETLDMSR